MKTNQVGPDRGYLGHLLVEEALTLLPAALEHQTQERFRLYVEEHLHHNSRTTRRRYAGYLANRYSQNGLMNLSLARALSVFADRRIGREILFFETIYAMPILKDIAANWVAFQPETGGMRQDLQAFVISRLPDIKPPDVIKRSVTGLKKFHRLRSRKQGEYIPIWVEPPLEAFVYVLCRLFPEPTVVPIEGFKASEDVRALLWQPGVIEPLLQQAEKQEFVSKITQLDAYYQFTLSDKGEKRLERLLDEAATATATSDSNDARPIAAVSDTSSKPIQTTLPYLEEILKDE